MNAAGDVSRAQDVIIYDPDLIAGWHVPDINAVLPAEAVVASVEVKSKATKSTIRGAVDNLATVKRVFGHRSRSGIAGNLLIDETVARPLGLALFFESHLGWPKFTEAVTSAVAAVDAEERPDVFLLLGHGGLTWPPDDTGKPLAARVSADRMLVFEGADSNLVLAYAISSHVCTWVPPHLNLFDYATGQPSGLDLELGRRSLTTPQPPGSWR